MDVGASIIPLTNQVPAVPAVPMVVDGVGFRLSITSGAPYLATQIAFVASERMDGGMLECGTTLEGSPAVIETATLQIGNSSEFMQGQVHAWIEYFCMDSPAVEHT